MIEYAKPVRVALADDSYLTRRGLQVALEGEPQIEVVGVCSSGDELLAVVAESRPEVVVADIRMPPSGDGEGIRLAGHLRNAHPEVGVVVLSQYLEPAYAVALLEGGAAGRAYLLKDRVNETAEVLHAIDAVASGGSVVDSAVVEALVESRLRSHESPLTELTPREREILAQIAQGRSNAAIASSLFLTKRSVEKHVHAIFAKLDLPPPEDVSRRVVVTLMFLEDEHSTPRPD